MRSNSVKEHINNNPVKGKKAMQFANLITTYQNDKVKSNAQKKIIQSNKSCHHYKPHVSNDLVFDTKKNINDKLKPYLQPQKIAKRHNRSKTQNFDPHIYQSSTLDLFKDIHIPSKLNSKKIQIKKEDSKKRLKTESLKRLNPVASFKASSKEFKKNFNTIGQKQTDQLSKQKKQKSTKRQNIKTYQQKQKAFEAAKNDLQVLKGKFKKQKFDNQVENRNKNFSMKDQRKDKSKKDDKNFSLLNLSQILHKSQYEDFLYAQQKQVKKKQIKSDRSSKSKYGPDRKKRMQAFKNLSQLVDHFTSTVTEQIEQDYQNKNYIKGINFQNTRDEIGGRSFSFMNHKINQEMKHGKSNFSTGVDSIAFDEEIKQLIKVKLKTQKQINHKISNQIKQIAFQHLKNQNNVKKQLKRQTKQNLEMQEKSARTFKQNDSSQRQTQNQEKLILLDLLQKYNQMTQKILPLIYQPHLSNPQQYILKDVPQKSYNSQIDFLQKYNQKYIDKYNQIALKNNQYQEIINALIRDGVNVEKYMISYFKSK